MKEKRIKSNGNYYPKVNINYKNTNEGKIVYDREYVKAYMSINTIQKAINIINNFNDKLHYFNNDERTGRVFTQISNMPSWLRRFILIDNEPVSEIDMVNCQPMLLTSILSDKQINYKKDVENGVFYETLANKLNTTREIVKNICWNKIFFNNNPVIKGDVKKALDKLYPGFVEELETIKTEDLLWKRLQSLESEIFINNFIANSDKKYITVHDSVICKTSDVGYFQNLIEIKLKEIGLKGKLNREDY